MKTRLIILPAMIFIPSQQFERNMFIGVPQAFDCKDFESYQERSEAYFTANDIGQIEDEENEIQKKKADKKKVVHAIAFMEKST